MCITWTSRPHQAQWVSFVFLRVFKVHRWRIKALTCYIWSMEAWFLYTCNLWHETCILSRILYAALFWYECFSMLFMLLKCVKMSFWSYITCILMLCVYMLIVLEFEAKCLILAIYMILAICFFKTWKFF